MTAQFVPVNAGLDCAMFIVDVYSWAVNFDA